MQKKLFSSISKKIAISSVLIELPALCLFSSNSQPNIIIVLADDQGYGDMSCHGNPYIKTPNIDKLHDESIRFTDFHVAPMSSPTRGQLLTGVDCLKNACMSTCNGRSLLREEFPTMGEIFSEAGYETGLFGKWHLGYNWPHRPMDKGFKETVFFYGFGLTGLGHYWNSDYYDPYYYHNEKLHRAKGYCNDFWFSEAKKWMSKTQKSKKPFLCYIPTNIAHFPEWIDSTYSKKFKGTPAESAAEFYGMINNLDENIGKLDKFLIENGLYDNTIVIYMTDNGTVHKDVYNAGMTGGKTARTEGGHRVPFFLRWPNGNLIQPADIKTPTEVQDVLPTVLELCNIKPQIETNFDGISLVPLLKGNDIKNRMFVVQYYQLSVKKYDAAVIWNNWRLVYGNQLFDIQSDIAQKNDVAAEHPEVLQQMKAYYEKWWNEVEPKIDKYVNNHIGSSYQKEVKLNASDWQDVRVDGNSSIRLISKKTSTKGAPWNIQVENDGTYILEFRRWPRESKAGLSDGLPAFIPKYGTPEPEGLALPISNVTILINGIEKKIPCSKNDKSVKYKLNLKKGNIKLQAWFCDNENNPLCGAFFAYIKKIN